MNIGKISMCTFNVQQHTARFGRSVAESHSFDPWFCIVEYTADDCMSPDSELSASK